MLGVIGIITTLFVNTQCQIETFEELVCQHCLSQDQLLEFVSARRRVLGPTIEPLGGSLDQIPFAVINKTRIQEIVLEEMKFVLPSYPPVQETSCQSCGEIQLKFGNTSGVFSIHPAGIGRIETYCDLTSDGGGWIVFQRRKDGSVNFYRDYTDYVSGFGDRPYHGEFWLGLELLHQLTKNGSWEMRIDLIATTGEQYFAAYSSFKIGPAIDNYRLHVSGFSGNTSDAIGYAQNGMQFSARDADNDRHTRRHCAYSSIGAWWYKYCNDPRSNLNGLYGQHSYKGVTWFDRKWLYLTFTEMKIRQLL